MDLFLFLFIYFSLDFPTQVSTDPFFKTLQPFLSSKIFLFTWFGQSSKNFLAVLSSFTYFETNNPLIVINKSIKQL